MGEHTITTNATFVPYLQGLRAAKSTDCLLLEDTLTRSLCRDTTDAAHAITATTTTVEVAAPNSSLTASASKYKFFYTDLLSCYRFLEQENDNVLKLIRAKQKPTAPPRRIDKLLDEFAFKVAISKDTHERETIQEASTEGRQAFMAKRWKARYCTLLDLTECHFNLLKLQSNHEAAGGYSQERTQNLQLIDNALHELTEVLGPWVVDKSYSDFSGFPVKDLNCGEQPSIGNTSYSDYIENDFVVPLSSVFLVDLLANHKLCYQRIKQQLDVKPQILHVLRKEKDRRNQLKQQCAHLKEEIAALDKYYESVCVRLRELESGESEVQRKSSVLTQEATHSLRKQNEDDYKANKAGIEDTENPDDLAISETDALAKEGRALDARIREAQCALREEEVQQSLIQKRLQRITGTVHAYARLYHENRSSCNLEIVSQNKLVVNDSTCFILDSVKKASECNNYDLYTNFNSMPNSCLSGHPSTIITIGKDAEETLFAPKDGLAFFSITSLIDLMNTKAESEFFLYIYALVFTDHGVVNLTKSHSTANTIHCEHGDPSFIDSTARCVRIDSSRAFTVFLNWLDHNRDSRPEGQLALALRVYGQNRLLKKTTHSSWLCFFPLSCSTERDALGRVFSALRRRTRPNFHESLFTQLMQKCLYGLSRTHLVLNLDLTHNNFSAAMADLAFANDAVKTTTETADVAGAKPIRPV